MFDAVRNNKKIVQIFLALITLPFAFFGVESYMRSAGTGDDVARIGDTKITVQQFQQAMRKQQDRLRAQMGNIDPKIFDTPEARKAILDDLINQRLLMVEASKQHLMASDDAVRRVRDSIDAFKVDGVYSPEQAAAVLRQQGMTPDGFVADVRNDLTMQQLLGMVSQSGFVSRTVSDVVLALQVERRDVQEFRLNIDAYLDRAKPSDEDIRKFYEENSKQFQVPEQAKVEYLVLSMDAIGAQQAVPEAEVKAWYEQNQEKFRQPETRRASHILLAVDKLGKKQAKAKADELLATLRKNPSAFADLAKKNSADPGSAAKGGDLGYFGRGDMTKPFEEAAFALKEGEMSGVVETDYGFHIIKLTGVRGGIRSYNEVKGEIEADLKKTAASRKFAEAAEGFSDLVYNQSSDSLKPAADKYKLAIKTSDWIGRQGGPAAGQLANEKVLAALFAEDSVKNRRNTEAIEIAPNTLLAARIADYRPAAMQPVESVKAGIESLLKHREAAALAKKDGEAKLEALKKGEDKLSWGASKSVTRLDPRLIPQAAVPTVFSLDSGKLPAYGGVELTGSGYALYKLVKVNAGEKLDDAHRQTLIQQLNGLAMREEAQLYLAALRARYKVEVNQVLLEAKEK
jgi:peptidyl-prolyl cis-trans isomerase D